MTAAGAREATLRLIKLISLVAYVDGDRCGLRKPIAASARELPEHLSVPAHQMCMYYAGALGHVRTGGEPSGEADFRDLADFTIPFVTNAASDAEHFLGDILIGSLSLLGNADARVVGRKWLDEVLDLCWHIKLAAVPEPYDFDE